MVTSSSRKPKPGKPAAKKRKAVARKPAPPTRRETIPSASAGGRTSIRFVRILARNRVGGRPTSNRFVLVCALEGDRIVDGEWFGKQVYPEDEGGEFAIIVREGREILYPTGYWRTNIGLKRIAVGELFTVIGDDEVDDDVWEITHVTTLAAT